MSHQKNPALEDLSKVQKRFRSDAHRKYRELMLSLCKAHADVPGCAELRQCLLDEDYARLLDVADEMVSQQYETAALHYAVHQLASCIRKFPFSPDLAKTDPEGKATTTFLASEHRCRRINQRLVARRRVSRRAAPYENEIDQARRWIAYVLGDSPDMASIYENCGFGPGASIGVHGDATNAGRKLLVQQWSVSPGAYHYGFVSILNHRHFRSHLCGFDGGGFASGLGVAHERVRYDKRIVVVKHNKIQFVPKTARTFRGIATEPLLNGFLQKGVDITMRIRLKRIGLDLSKQEPNAELARLGSIDDSDDGFVTIDLRGASDGLSIELIRELLPPEWFRLLNQLRSREYELKGSVHRFHKFCSMGNGFCFPLETLVFAAACRAVGAGRPGIDFRVYGDDIVVRKKYAADLIALLCYLGFSTNKEKTFLQGPFRESCGSDYFGGEDVRPFILDDAFDSVENVYKYLNLTGANPLWREFFAPARQLVLRWLPERWRLFRPYPGEVDSGIDLYDGDEHLSCPSCRFGKPLNDEVHVSIVGDTWQRRTTRVYGPYTWIWKELEHRACPDSGMREDAFYQEALMFAALAGYASHAPFTHRRKTRTKVVEKHHPGATSQWTPADLPGVKPWLRVGSRKPRDMQ